MASPAVAQMELPPEEPISFPELFVMLEDEDGQIDSRPVEEAAQELPSGGMTFDQLRSSGSSTGAEPEEIPAGTIERDPNAGRSGSGESIQNSMNGIRDGRTDDQSMARDEDDLRLADVIASLYRAYPEIAAARQQETVASGMLLESYGAFDTKLQGHSLNEPTGFYENYRHGIGVARDTWWGGYLAAGYRVGRGEFQPWYLERETETGGEFKLATVVPLLQGRAIDPNRVAVFQARLERQMVGPLITEAILNSSFDATMAYWDWVAAGAVLEAQRELLELAEMRGEQFEKGVKAGLFAEIDLILNQQLIAERRAKVLETEQKFRLTAFKLSVFLRDELGRPLVPRNDWLPTHFPVVQEPPVGDFQSDLAAALSRRPEPRLLQLEIQQFQLDRQLAQNQMLPRLDFVAEGSQDMGLAASSSDDKGEFVLVIGVQGEVPIQRSKARGKIQSTSGKINQINEKLRLTRDKIGAELQAAYNALMLATEIVEQSEISLRAAFETLERYRFAFDRGKIDLIYLNLLETKANETEIKLVEAQRNWFTSLSQMQVALGLDPLDQAMVVSELPVSSRPGPGNLPEFEPVELEALDKDWERRENRPSADELDEAVKAEAEKAEAAEDPAEEDAP